MYNQPRLRRHLPLQMDPRTPLNKHHPTPRRHLHRLPPREPLLRRPNHPKRLRHAGHPLRHPKPGLPRLNPLPHQHRARAPLLQGIHGRLPARPPRRGPLQLGDHPYRAQRLRARLALRRRDGAHDAG